MPQAEAEWSSDECSLRMRESVFVGMQRGDPHHRFVVFHELSHYALGHEGFRNRIEDPNTRSYSAARLKHEEAEASRLAAILMAPEYLIPDESSPEDIASLFWYEPDCGDLTKRGSGPGATTSQRRGATLTGVNQRDVAKCARWRTSHSNQLR